MDVDLLSVFNEVKSDKQHTDLSKNNMSLFFDFEELDKLITNKSNSESNVEKSNSELIMEKSNSVNLEDEHKIMFEKYESIERILKKCTGFSKLKFAYIKQHSAKNMSLSYDDGMIDKIIDTSFPNEKNEELDIFEKMAFATDDTNAKEEESLIFFDDNNTNYLKKMALLYRDGKYDEMINYYDNSVFFDNDKKNGCLNLYIGHVYQYIKHDITNAKKHYEISAQCNNSRAYVKLAEYYGNCNDIDKMIKYLQISVDINQDPFALYYLGLYYNVITEIEKMDGLFIVALQKKNTNVIYNIGLVYDNMHEQNKHIKCNELAIKLDKNIYALYDLATYYNKQGDNVKEHQLYDEYLKSYEENKLKILKNNEFLEQSIVRTNIRTYFNVLYKLAKYHNTEERILTFYNKHEPIYFTENENSNMFHTLASIVESKNNRKLTDMLYKKAIEFNGALAIYDYGKYLFNNSDKEYKKYMTLALSKGITKAKNYI